MQHNKPGVSPFFLLFTVFSICQVFFIVQVGALWALLGSPRLALKLAETPSKDLDLHPPTLPRH